MPEYEAVIGLETHIQLNTTTKIFCSCKADSWNDPPNKNICPVCTGLPGVLPVLNQAVVEKAALLAAAMHAEITFTQTCPRVTRSRSMTCPWRVVVTWSCPCLKDISAG
jgi:aspartyl-tRNA(Asn)/glutamyl-tRNA(Gln) amidotransferase subunit B